MKTLPLAHVKANLSRLVDQVVETDEEIVITRNGRPAAVLVSPEEYEGWKETQAIRSDRELMAEIRRGLRALKRGGRLEELVRGLHPGLRRKVRAALDLIRTDPAAGKALRDALAGLRSLRVGRFRIVYRVAPG